MRYLTLITTGGTIEKTYDEMTGELTNRLSVVRRMLEHLRLEDTEISIVDLMQKDSLHMTDEDRAAIVRAVRDATTLHSALGVLHASPHAIVILHGTDTLTVTGEQLLRDLSPPSQSPHAPFPTPIVLTGAMRPFEMVRSDALQNLTEALFAAGMLADARQAGVYCVAHGRALQFPGVKKDRERGTFARQ